MKRSQVFAGLFAVVLVLSVPAPVLAQAADGDVLTEATTSEFSVNPFGSSPGPEAVRHGADGTPSWIVTVENGSMDSIQDWANASQERRILHQDNASNWAVVIAPSDAAGATSIARLLNDGLAHKSYVEAIEVNRRLSYAEPVDQLTRREDATTPGGFGMQLRARASDDIGYSAAGIAFRNDSTATTMAENGNASGLDNVTVTGEGYTLAVIDTGVNTAGGALWDNGTANATVDRIDNASYDFIQEESVNATAGKYDAVEDPNGHGTHVASSAAANTENDSFDGIAPNATVLALRALDEDGQGSTADIARAVRYAADHDADVITMSLGSPVYSPALCDAIDYAFDNGVSSVTVAVGNDRQASRWTASPSDCNEAGIVAVTATNVSDGNDTAVANFANLGDDPGTGDFSGQASAGQQVDVGAPGMKITARVATTSATTKDVTLSGTSMAAPQVGAASILALDANSSLVGEERALHDQIRESALASPNAATREIGAGRLAIDNLVDEVDGGDQAAAMTETASARDNYWKAMSDSSGGLLA